MSDFIKDIWDRQAALYKESHWVSWGDHYAIDLEVDNISQHIQNGFKVLDVGCANGYATLKQFRSKNIDITGIDYSERMIAHANATLGELGITTGIRFQNGDVTTLEFDAATFDVTYTTRVLINILNWEDQKRGIQECLRVTKNGGTVLLSEAFWEPLVLLNAVRKLVNLPPLVEHDFNRYLKENKLAEYLDSLGLQYTVVDFSSVYYLGSRVLRELVTDADRYPGYSNPINEIFYNIEKDYSGGGFGIQKSFVITK